MHVTPKQTRHDYDDDSNPKHGQLMCRCAASGGTVRLCGFLGNANKKARLREFEADCILVCAQELPMAFPDLCEYLKLHIADNPRQVIHSGLTAEACVGGEFRRLGRKELAKGHGNLFRFVCQWLDERVVRQGRNVVVHCAAGGSRSAAIVCLYLMHAAKLPCREALEYMQSRRSNVCPNWGFLQQLIEWEQTEINFTAVATVSQM